MVQTGAAPGQRPSTLLLPHLRAHPWWTLPDIEAVLLARAEALREEFQLLLATNDQARAADTISVASGRWSQHYLLEEGKWNASLLARLPVTRDLLESLPICESSVGYCYLSTVEPGTAIQPHHGPTNVKLRCQFPLLLEDGCAASLCVNGEARPYEEGKLLVFDDSFEHSVRHLSGGKRTVLIFDIWHPDVRAEPILLRALSAALPVSSAHGHAIAHPAAPSPSAARTSQAWPVSLDLAPDGVLAKLFGRLPFVFVWTCVRLVSRRWAQLGASDEVWRAAFHMRWRTERSMEWAPPPASEPLPGGPHAWARAYFAEFGALAFEPLPDEPKGRPPVVVKMLMARPFRFRRHE